MVIVFSRGLPSEFQRKLNSANPGKKTSSYTLAEIENGLFPQHMEKLRSCCAVEARAVKWNTNNSFDYNKQAIEGPLAWCPDMRPGDKWSVITGALQTHKSVFGALFGDGTTRKLQNPGATEEDLQNLWKAIEQSTLVFEHTAAGPSQPQHHNPGTSAPVHKFAQPHGKKWHPQQADKFKSFKSLQQEGRSMSSQQRGEQMAHRYKHLNACWHCNQHSHTIDNCNNYNKQQLQDLRAQLHTLQDQQATQRSNPPQQRRPAQQQRQPQRDGQRVDRTVKVYQRDDQQQGHSADQRRDYDNRERDRSPDRNEQQGRGHYRQQRGDRWGNGGKQAQNRSREDGNRGGWHDHY
jgi:hypothetical protein